MPKRRGGLVPGLVYHVLNRGVRRMTLFEGPQDYRTFMRCLQEAQHKVPLRLLAYCIMPNHFHLVVWPSAGHEVSAFMMWATGTHGKRWHRFRGTTGTGAVYQNRFKAFPVASDRHLLTVCRYVERNPVRAGLVARAEQWPWSSFSQRWVGAIHPALCPWPVLQPLDWIERVNEMEPEPDVARLRHAAGKGAPFGDPAWVVQTARAFGLEATLRPPGRRAK
jgi:putative transposase